MSQSPSSHSVSHLGRVSKHHCPDCWETSLLQPWEFELSSQNQEEKNNSPFFLLLPK